MTDYELKDLRPVSGITIPGRGNERVHPASVARWITIGVGTPNGERVKLRAVRIGRRWMTTDAWIADFIAAMTAASIPESDASIRSPAERSRASSRAAAELAAAGA
jgi:hypothetical protein